MYLPRPILVWCSLALLIAGPLLAQTPTPTLAPPLPAPRSAGANLLLHIQARDAILRQINHAGTIEDSMVAQGQEYRSLFQGDTMPNQRSVISTIDEEIRRTNDFVTEARTRTDEERLRLLQSFDGRFPPRIPAIGAGAEVFLGRVTALRRVIETGARAEVDSLRRSSITFQSELTSFQTLYRAHVDQLVEILTGNPTYFYELIGRASFTEMNTMPQIEQAATVHTQKLTALRQGLTQLPGELGDRRSVLARQYDNYLSEIRRLLGELEAQRVRSETLTVEQAEQGFGKNVSEKSFNVLLVIFGLCFLVLFVGPMLYRSSATDSIAAQILTGPFILQFSTVFILCASIVLLGIGGFIKEDQLPVLLAGISGYVLGQLGRGAARPEAPPPPR